MFEKKLGKGMVLVVRSVRNKFLSYMCLRKSWGRGWCWLYGVYEINFYRTCVKVFRFFFKFRVSRLAFIESQPWNPELGGL